MSQAPSDGLNDQGSFFPNEGFARILLLVLIFGLGIGVRLYRITEPLTEFHHMRQYRAAIFAHSIYAKGASEISDTERDLATLNADLQGVLEPQVMEHLVAWTYGIVGEQLWVPRLYSILFWTVGGVFLYLLGRQVLAHDSAVVALCVYFFLPFGITASRTFQPDSLMVMLYLGALYSIWRYHNGSDSWRWLLAGGLLSGAALFVKPLVIYALAITYLLLEWQRQGSLRAMVNRKSVVFGGIMFLPIFAYYVNGLLTNPALQTNAHAQFIPRLLTTRTFWTGWLLQIEQVVGVVVFIIAMLGVMLVKERRSQVFLAGLWLAYGLFGVTFTYLVSTHNYYQLHFIPLVGLSLGPLVVVVLQQIRQRLTLRTTRLVLAYVMVLLVFSLGTREYIVRRAFKMYGPIRSDFPEIAETIGEETGHSLRVISLSEGYSLPLWYHARISGTNWPTVTDMIVADYRAEEAIVLDDVIAELFEIEDYDYFVVTNMAEYHRQPALEEYVEANLEPMVETNSYMIFDLRGR